MSNNSFRPDVQKALKDRLVRGKPPLCKGGLYSKLDFLSAAKLEGA